MKRFEARKAYLVCMVIMSVFVSILSGCGGGGGGHWNEPAPVRPTVVSTVPPTATPISLVQPDTDITVTFNKDMARASILAANVFTVTGPAGLVPGAAIPVTYNVATKTATFNPLAPLAVGTYTATVKGTGANVATDTAGNALAGDPTQPTVAHDYVWHFTVDPALAPVLRPRVSSTKPLTTNPGPTPNVATSTEVSATFNKTMDPLSIQTGTFTLMSGLVPVPPAAIPVTIDSTNKIITFHPLAALDPGITYTATIKGIGPFAAKDAAGNELAGDPTQPTVPNDYRWIFVTTNVAHLGPATTVNLGITEPYGVLAGTAITLDGPGVHVDGDVGISPGSTCSNCNANTVTGVIEVATANAAAAKSALITAYDDAIGRVTNLCTINGTLTIDPPPACGGTSNGTFAPGLYWSGTSINLPVNGTITLDAQNDPTAVFIFQSESTINSLANSHVILANGADAKNVFWVAKSSSTIGGTTADFKGTVIALSSITVNTGTNMLGRALARNGAVTVQSSALITVPPK